MTRTVSRNSPLEQTLALARDYYQQAAYKQAIEQAEAALALQADAVHALEIVALSYAALGRFDDALVLLQEAARQEPDNAQVFFNLAVMYQQLGQSRRAKLLYHRCLGINPRHCDALWNYGELLRLDEDFAQALQCFQALCQQGAYYPALDHRMAVCLHALGDDEGSLACFARELDGQAMDAALTHWERAHVHLQRGDFAQGWDDYEYRFAAGAKTSIACFDYPFKTWQGEPLQGKTLLLHGEQGLGDEMMFASIIPDLLAEQANIVLACRPALVRLFSLSFPGVTVRASCLASAQPAYLQDLAGGIDFQLPLGSLPALRRRHEKDFPGQAYLRCDVQQATEMAARLARELSRDLLFRHPAVPDICPRRKVGLMWGSNPATAVAWGQRRAQQKSIPLKQLQVLQALLPSLRFVSLQNHELGDEAADAPGLELIDMSDELHDMADTAALISQLDLVICVDTSVAHLAAAMGKPTWLLLMARADWRWMSGRSDSPWYPRVRIFRQARQHDWQPVISELLSALQQWQRG